MTTFDDRERAFENKFAHDAEMQFRAEARAVMKLALWAGREFDRSGDAVVTYSKELIAHWLGAPGRDHVFARIAEDAAAAGKTLTAADAGARYAALLAESKAELYDQSE
jgi:hypothetical protein